MHDIQSQLQQAMRSAATNADELRAQVRPAPRFTTFYNVVPGV